MALGNEEAAVLWCEERFGADGSKFFEVEMDLAPADLELMADASTTGGFLNTVIEAFRQGVRGFAQDVLVNTQPWSFDLAAVTATVRVLHGEADTIVPIAHGRHTAELIPGATLVVYPSHGHLSIMTELPQLAADLASAIG